MALKHDMVTTGDRSLDRKIILTKVSLELYTAVVVTLIFCVLKGWL